MSGGWADRKIHFVGAGGAGMSGLALAVLELGASVTGSDRDRSSYLERLEGAGIEIAVGHDAANVPDGAEVVLSSAIGEDNPEVLGARDAGLRILHRSELLAEACQGRQVVAIAGTHGKTTTTAMVAWALRSLGIDSAFFVGGEVPDLGPGGTPTNASWSSEGPVVVEADESDGSFLRLDPAVAVVTNLEMDHHANWDGMAALRRAFAEFVTGVGTVVLPEADPATAFLNGMASETVTFNLEGPGPEALALKVPGRHNLLDARAALAALQAIGVESEGAAAALADFPGVSRRLEFRGEMGGIPVYDDYAHHPTEVRATIEALREIAPGRVLAVFQPHLYSRTQALAPEFGEALAGADRVVVTDVYPAREVPEGALAGVSGLDILREATDRNGGRGAWWAPDLEAADRAVRSIAEQGDLVVTIGAGDVSGLAGRLVTEGDEGS
ncbi:MAG: UDP-N-acetylmuramate--L-alanine ligase [Solirubrobacterales bacterium]